MFGNMKEMLKQAQNMKSQMKKIKKELESIEVEGVSANGACKGYYDSRYENSKCRN